MSSEIERLPRIHPAGEDAASQEVEYLGQMPMEEGEYFLRYISHRLSAYKSQPKIIINFRIVGSEHADQIVPRFYNVDVTGKSADGKPIWQPRRGSAMVKELIALFGQLYDVHSVRLERIPLKKWFSAHTVIGEVVRVPKDGNGNPVPLLAQQVRIKRLITLEEGDEGSDLSLPCLTSPSSSHPHPVEKPAKVDVPRDKEDWLGSRDRQDLGISEPSDDKKLVERLILEGAAETGEDIEKLTGGRITADQARELHFMVE